MFLSDREEGFAALFKGGPARILRSSPQFGFTLVAYEYLHKVRLKLGILMCVELIKSFFLLRLQFVPVSIVDPRGCLVHVLIYIPVSVQGWPEGCRDCAYVWSFRRCHANTRAERAQDPSGCSRRLWSQGRVHAGQHQQLFVVRGRGRRLARSAGGADWFAYLFTIHIGAMRVPTYFSSFTMEHLWAVRASNAKLQV